VCGIAGILRPGGAPVEAGDLRAMGRALAHRGPDDEGFHHEGSLGLAHRRLAILDLSPAGRQPMPNEDGTVWLAYNGQLYGFEPLRRRLEQLGHRFRSHTDTEVIVHLYEEDGDGLLASIDGMFAFALWDARRRRLLLARDRLGIKPLYYARRGGDLAFASELKALLALPWLPREVSASALVHYLYQSSVPGDVSVFEGVRKLAPGEYLVAEDGAIRTGRYWPGPADHDRPESPGAAAEGLRARLEAAVRSHLVADVPVGTFLSGGLDSTAVTWHARRAVEGPLHTFSVRFDGPPAYDEGAAALEVARALGTTHHELRLGPDAVRDLPRILSGNDEPFAISSAIALHHLARFAREHVKVVLTGDGADEILGGYPWRHEPDWGRHARPGSALRGLALTMVRSLRGSVGTGPGLTEQLAARLGRLGRPDERYAEIVCAFTPEEMERLLAPDLGPLARAVWADSALRRAYRAEGGTDEVNRRLRADLRTTLVDEMLMKVDRTTMAAGLEARVPFLDRHLVEWAMALPGVEKVRRGVGKIVLRRALQPVLPKVAGRRKHGFNIPLGAWLRGPLRALLRDVLAPESVRRRGLLRASVVERLVAAHLGGRGDHSRKLFSLMVLELWLAERQHAADLAAAPLPPAAARA
jgi:asparagine synthase (glutamine-hydrolysing)